MSLTLFLKRGKTKGGRGKKNRQKIHVCTIATLKDKGLAANANDSMDAGGMAAADVTQASEQTKLREFLTKHRFKEP